MASNLIYDIESYIYEKLMSRVRFTSFTLSVLLETDNDSLIECLHKHIYYKFDSNFQRYDWNVVAYECRSIYLKYETEIRQWKISNEYENEAYLFKDDNSKIIVPLDSRCIILIQPSKKRVIIIGYDFRGLFLDTHKVIRRIFTTFSYKKGWMCLHASGVIKGDKSILFVGNEGAGKTSCALNALDSRLCSGFHGNDRIWCINTEDDIKTAIWPTSVIPVGIGLAKSLPLLSHNITPELHIKAGGIAFLLQKFPLITNSLTNIISNMKEFDARIKFKITPSELNYISSINLVPEASLKTIVFPKISFKNNKYEIKKISGAHAFDLLMRNIHFTRESQGKWLFTDKNIDNETYSYDENIRFIEQKGINFFKAEFSSDLCKKAIYEVMADF